MYLFAHHKPHLEANALRNWQPTDTFTDQALICENIFSHHKASSEQHSSHAVTDQEHEKHTSQATVTVSDSADNKTVNQCLCGRKW